MTDDTRCSGKESGLALLALVFLLMAIVDMAAMAFVFGAGSRATATRRQVFMEQAMYVAEAGAETSVAYLGTGQAVPATLKGNVGEGSFVAQVFETNVVGLASKKVIVRSVGTVRGVSRTVTLEGIRRKTWAEFAFWVNNNRSIYFITGDIFTGRVHSNEKFYFDGSPEFMGLVTSAADSYQGSTNKCVFHEGFFMDVPSDSMANVDFAAIKTKAKLVLTGPTTIVMNGTNMLVTNSQKKWKSEPVSVPQESVIYVETVGTSIGDVSISGQLDGRVTVVAERDISIVDNLSYARDPAVDKASDDTLGLISGRDVVVPDEFPNNGVIYAHIMATGQKTSSTTDGSFGVENYSTRNPSGDLTVYGGIVQDYRGPVGTFDSRGLKSGFNKSYTFDKRMTLFPPPEYPTLSDEFTWDVWREGN